jgi:DNA-binding PadR family transcriptional regulator
MALEHLRDSVTKQNLWLYILSVLIEGPASPAEIEKGVLSRFGFSPAKITFYTVLYKLRKESLVEKMAESFRSKYKITEGGEQAFRNGISTLANVVEKLKTNDG